MGIKGEVGGGFPQPKPAFTALVCYMRNINNMNILFFRLIN